MLGHASGRKRADRHLTFDALEERTLLTGASFAQFAGNLTPQQTSTTVAFRVLPDDFHLLRGAVQLGFVLESAPDHAINPGLIKVTADKGASLTLAQRADCPGTTDSFTMAWVTPGTFNVRVKGQGGTTGAWSLDAFLIGDANGDYRVDGKDVALIRSLRGKSASDAAYVAAADANRDGIVDGKDVNCAQANHGAVARLRPLAISVSLDPTSDADGNGVVLQPNVLLVGQTTPGATVQLSAGGVATQHVKANGNGQYQLHATLTNALTTLHVRAKDAFGQEVSADEDVRLGDTITDWNDVLLNVIRDNTTLSDIPYPHRVVPMSPPAAARALAIMHVAMFDAVNSIEGTYQSLHSELIAPSNASMAAAAASAAHEALLKLIPRYPDRYDAALAETLATVPNGQAKTDGIAYGRAVADEVLAWRSTDGAAAQVKYVPGADPDDWQPTFPDYLPALLPQWPNVTPFAMTSDTQFRPPPPPDLTSAAYAAAVNQVKDLGAFDSTVRTPEQTQIALFWADGGGTFTPPGHWNQIAADVAMARGDTLVQDARLFALLNVGMADAGIVAWDAKYAYGEWRPIDAIRKADQDGNDQTTADPTWIPLLKTPNFPSYVSGHSTFSGAADAILTAFFGDNVHFTSQSDGHDGFTEKPLANVITRSFTSFTEAADEAGMSRIYGGIHYSFDNVNGLAAGRALGTYVVQNFLTPN